MTQKHLLFSTPVRLLAPVLAAFALVSGAAKAQEPSPTLMEAGVWVNDTADGAVEIYICQDKASRLCGRIVWLKEPLNAEGVPKRDRYNPKPEMQNRPICGLPVLGNLARDSDGGFDEGWIYDPKAGKSYSAAIRLSARDQLIVTGYLGMKFMGKSFTWTRAPASLQRCEGAPGAVQPISTGAKPAAKPSAKQPVTAPGTSAAATPAKPKPPSTSAASAGPAAAKTPATTATAKAPATSKAATASKTPAHSGATAAVQQKAPTANKAAAATDVSVPKPKPAQKPVKAVANSGTAAAAPQPAAKPVPKTVQEADTATSWSGQ